MSEPEAGEAPQQGAVAWAHDGEGRIDVISDRSKAIWLKCKPAHVKHYTIPLYAAAPAAALPERREGRLEEAEKALRLIDEIGPTCSHQGDFAKALIARSYWQGQAPVAAGNAESTVVSLQLPQPDLAARPEPQAGTARAITRTGEIPKSIDSVRAILNDYDDDKIDTREAAFRMDALLSSAARPEDAYERCALEVEQHLYIVVRRKDLADRLRALRPLAGVPGE